jgi:hypothetical protein
VASRLLQFGTTNLHRISSERVDYELQPKVVCLVKKKVVCVLSQGFLLCRSTSMLTPGDKLLHMLIRSSISFVTFGLSRPVTRKIERWPKSPTIRDVLTTIQANYKNMMTYLCYKVVSLKKDILLVVLYFILMTYFYILYFFYL